MSLIDRLAGWVVAWLIASVLQKKVFYYKASPSLRGRTRANLALMEKTDISCDPTRRTNFEKYSRYLPHTCTLFSPTPLFFVKKITFYSQISLPILWENAGFAHHHNHRQSVSFSYLLGYLRYLVEDSRKVCVSESQLADPFLRLRGAWVPRRISKRKVSTLVRWAYAYASSTRIE